MMRVDCVAFMAMADDWQFLFMSEYRYNFVCMEVRVKDMLKAPEIADLMTNTMAHRNIVK